MYMMRNTFVFSSLLALLLWGQTGFAQLPGAYEEADFFEGTLTYSFSVKGPLGEQLQKTNPISRMTMHLKEGNFIIHLYGEQNQGASEFRPDAFESTRLFIADSNEMYTIDTRNKRAFKGEKYTPDESEPPSAEFSGDSMRIQGYWCYSYVVKKPDETITYFCSPKIRANTAFFAQTDARANFLTKGLRGMIPLMTIRQSRERIIKIKCVQVARRELGMSNFRIPPGFEVSPMYDYRR